MNHYSVLNGMLLSFVLFNLVPGTHGQSLPNAWGWGFYGQMGNNNAAYFNPVPVAVSTGGALSGKTITALAPGGYHSLGLCSDGTVVAWGSGNQGQIGSGQLGNNSTPPTLAPVAVSTSSGTSALFGKTVIAIAAGSQFNLALCSDGTVAAWGWNLQGELGDTTTTQRDAPVAVNQSGSSALSGKTVTAIAAGDQHGLALCSDGTIAAWGVNGGGQLGNNSTANSSIPVAVTTVGTPLAGRTVVAIAAGGAHNVALCSDGTLVAWGHNQDGKLGDNTTTSSPVPVAVMTAGTPLAGRAVVAIAAGGSHSLALCADGTLVAWGNNSNGQLGDNSISSRLKPVAVTTAGTALAGKTVTAIAAGSSHSLALCSDGTLTAWGWDFHGELGDNDNTQSLSAKRLTPVAVITSQFFTAIFPGSSAYHNLALASPCAPPTLDIGQYAGITIDGTVGCQYRIDYTTSLAPPVTWFPLATITLASNPYLYIDTSVPAGARFYRAVLQ